MSTCSSLGKLSSITTMHLNLVVVVVVVTQSTILVSASRFSPHDLPGCPRQFLPSCSRGTWTCPRLPLVPIHISFVFVTLIFRPTCIPCSIKACILSLMFCILCDIRVRSSVKSRSSKHVINNNWILALLTKTVLITQSRVIRNSKRDNRQPCLFQSSCSKVRRSTVPHKELWWWWLSSQAAHCLFYRRPFWNL